MSTPQEVTDALADYTTKKAAFEAANVVLNDLSAAANTALVAYDDAIQAAVDARAVAAAPYFAAQEYQDALSAVAATQALMNAARETAQTTVQELAL